MKPREQHATDRHRYTSFHYIVIAIVMLLSVIAFLYLQRGHAAAPALADYCPTINWTSRECATYLSDHLERELRGPQQDQ